MPFLRIRLGRLSDRSRNDRKSQTQGNPSSSGKVSLMGHRSSGAVKVEGDPLVRTREANIKFFFNTSGSRPEGTCWKDVQHSQRP